MNGSAPNHSDPPVVTAIAVCYNHGRFLNECLESIKAQNYPKLQIIITDDGSRDASSVMIRSWIEANPCLNITFLQNEQNLGLCKTLNRALSLARGKYISIIA